MELKKGFYWVHYNHEEWTIGEYMGNDEWLIPGNETAIESGWMDKIGERIERKQKRQKPKSFLDIANFLIKL